ncbi:hypothetical protein C7974DRAFT_412944 [Boeremia exigua]|uniref:uncharacterized protein n=1 Tax=Boeremia exigua TaxID=749465 RepID=UPI001E8D8B89|nr:uncharacterized protein C7974DRAFT_412944 [Boeremia exigua]KAH6629121.1 hypothetical protein C7974DRAFT_412944 [Boeremia exigua]
MPILNYLSYLSYHDYHDFHNLLVTFHKHLLVAIVLHILYLQITNSVLEAKLQRRLYVPLNNAVDAVNDAVHADPINEHAVLTALLLLGVKYFFGVGVVLPVLMYAY